MKKDTSKLEIIELLVFMIGTFSAGVIATALAYIISV